MHQITGLSTRSFSIPLINVGNQRNLWAWKSCGVEDKLLKLLKNYLISREQHVALKG